MKKLFRNKKGESAAGQGEDDGSNFVVSSKIYYFALVLILILLSFVAFVLISSSYIDSLAAVPKVLDRDLVVARITNTCFAAKDPITGYDIQNTINVSKFNEKQLLECFTNVPAPRMFLSLKSVKGNELTGEKPEFDKIAFFTAKGGLDYWDERYTLAYIDGEYYPALLRVDQE